MASVDQHQLTPQAASGASRTPQRRKVVGRMGPWQLVALVAETNLSRVYLARPTDSDDQLPVSYVVKALRKEWWHDPQAIEIYRREALVGMRVSHPNVVSVLSAQVHQPPFYLVQPCLPGATAAQRQAAGTLRLPEILWVARQVADGLAAIHEQVGMVHGDVKPANVVIGPEGHATLLDLGFARSPREAGDWLDQPLLGSLAYLAPENFTSRIAASPASDLYSLGVMLYELITGQLPFPTCDPEELVSLHRTAKPRCVRSHIGGLPKPVASLVHSLLAKDPLRRPGSAHEVAQRLVRLEIDAFGQYAA